MNATTVPVMPMADAYLFWLHRFLPSILPWAACHADLDALTAWLEQYRIALDHPLPTEAP